MESENVRVMRAGYEAFNRGDFDSATELMHPEIVFTRARVKARGSGIVMEDRAFHVWTVQGGKATRLEFYADRSEARQAAGLDPEG